MISAGSLAGFCLGVLAVLGVKRWVLCRLPWPLFFHRVRVIEEYDDWTRKLQCRDCGTYFAMSDRHGAVLPWDEDYERITCDMYGIPRTKK